ncbi:Oxalate decarboxylase OxdC [Colletotrichum sidae]|uniref:Oxalate decarboxylase OxdC n=1 Tax=Colletotrichum sidae TaxID=1347389 RepID=A0A4R8TGL7_9PEZI|nr:Oxalate decarboxylase OxdC [Colletotrichum sidae]
MPAPQMGNYGENDGPVGGVSPPIPSVTAPSGSLRGDSSLLGDNAPRPDADQSDSAIVKDVQLVPGQEADVKLGLYLNFDDVDVPQPIRGELGSTDPGPRTYAYEKLNPDLFAPPSTDKGDVKNAMWPLSLSHNRLGSQRGGGLGAPAEH